MGAPGDGGGGHGKCWCAGGDADVVRGEERNQHEREVRQERWDGQSGPPMHTMHRHPLKTPWPNCGHCSAARPRSAVGQNSLCASNINAPKLSSNHLPSEPRVVHPSINSAHAHAHACLDRVSRHAPAAGGSSRVALDATAALVDRYCAGIRRSSCAACRNSEYALFRTTCVVSHCTCNCVAQSFRAVPACVSANSCSAALVSTVDVVLVKLAVWLVSGRLSRSPCSPDSAPTLPRATDFIC
jgi:hypothetical protein